MASAAARKEMSSMVPAVAVGVSDQAKIGFVNESGRLQRIAGRLGVDPSGGKATQLLIDKRKQVGGRLAVARRHGIQKQCHIGHAASVTGRDRR